MGGGERLQVWGMQRLSRLSRPAARLSTLVRNGPFAPDKYAFWPLQGEKLHACTLDNFGVGSLRVSRVSFLENGFGARTGLLASIWRNINFQCSFQGYNLTFGVHHSRSCMLRNRAPDRREREAISYTRTCMFLQPAEQGMEDCG